MGVSLKGLINEQLLAEIAGRSTFERGQHYAANGRVLSITEMENQTITAQVQGSQLYEIRLWLKGKKLQYSCNCLFAIEGAFCKHCVAVGLALINLSSSFECY
jgi:uncharacterized Zn finger protein